MECGRCHKDLPLEGIKFCPFCGDTLQSAPEERRKGIVVFGDLSGFTALSERIDPDELRDLIDRIMRKFVHIVEQHGGVVDKIIGDCIMFLFNVEKSYGDDPVRTLETIEDIQAYLSEFNETHQTTLELHFGAAFGTVSVGIVGNSRTVMGDTVNLAQRLLNAAQSGEVVVSPSFSELFPPSYKFEEMEPVWLKGKLEPVTPFRYHGQIQFEEELSPFVGRSSEVSSAIKSIEQANSNQKQARILFQGPFGIGKGRILSEIFSHFESDAFRSAQVTLQDGGDGFPAPVKRLMEDLIRISKDISEDEHWGMSIQEDFWEQTDIETFSSLMLQTLRRICKQCTLLIGVQHLERADSSTLDFLHKLLTETQTLPLCLLFTSLETADFLAESTIQISPLCNGEAQELFSKLVDSQKAESLGFQKLVTQCAGNPLFIQELARGVNADLPMDKLFSGNIELLLASRLDALDNEQKELVKQASIFGTQIPTKYLAVLSNKEEADVLHRLGNLAFFDYEEKTNSLIFRDELLRVSAYDRINLRTRKAWHQQLGEMLLDEKASPELIAHHFLKSERKREALRMSLAAGRALARNPKQKEALFYIKQTEQLARELHDEKALLDALEIRFMLDSKGFSIDQALERLEIWQKDFMLSKLEGSESRLALLRGSFFFERRMYSQALTEVQKAREDLPREKQIELELLHERILYRLGKTKEVVHRGLKFLRSGKLEEAEKGDFFILMGSVSYIDKEIEQAEDFYRKAAQIYREANDLRGIWKTVINLGNIARSRSHYEASREYYLEACEHALLLGDLLSYCKGLLRVADVNIELLRIEEALGNFDRALEILQSHENPSLEALTRMLLGNALRNLGDFERAKETLDAALLYFEHSDDSFGHGRALRSLAMLHQDLENFERAFTLLKECAPLLKNHPDQLQYIALQRAEIHFHQGELETAQEQLGQFQSEHPEKTCSPDILLRFRILDSLLSHRKDLSKFECICELLQKTQNHSAPWKRLVLLAEALEYGFHKDYAAEAIDILHRMRKSLPPRFRRAFDRRKAIIRLNELLQT